MREKKEKKKSAFRKAITGFRFGIVDLPRTYAHVCDNSTESFVINIRLRKQPSRQSCNFPGDFITQEFQAALEERTMRVWILNRLYKCVTRHFSNRLGETRLRIRLQHRDKVTRLCLFADQDALYLNMRCMSHVISEWVIFFLRWTMGGEKLCDLMTRNFLRYLFRRCDDAPADCNCTFSHFFLFLMRTYSFI